MLLEIISGLLLSLVTTLYAEGACEDNIYLEYGQRGEVACEFEGYDVIGWINGGGDHEGTSPFIYVEESVVRGRGHDSGNYSMYPNGSLIINHVTFENHYNYTVLLVPSVGLNEYLTVEVKVYVKPFPEYPVVNEVTDQQFIVQDIDGSTGVLTCATSGVRPAVGLEWVYPEDMMSMESKTTVTGNKDSTSNTLLNSTFTVHGPLSGSITVQCVVTGELSKLLYSQTTIHLLIQRDFPVVNGLVGLHHVVLEVTPEAEISCSMNGVSQGISLEWLVITPAASNEIHLEDTRSQTSNEDGTADVMLNSSLSVTSNSIDRVTLRCQVTGESAADFQQVTTVELLIARSTSTATVFDYSEVISRWILAVVIIIAVLHVAVIVMFIALFKIILVKIAKKHVAPDPENREDIAMKAANHQGSQESLLELETQTTGADIKEMCTTIISLLELKTQTTAADIKEMYTTIISLLNDMKHSADAGSSSDSSDSAIA